MVDHVVFLHALEVSAVEFVMMSPVVDHIVTHVAEHGTGHNSMVIEWGKNESVKWSKNSEVET